MSLPPVINPKRPRRILPSLVLIGKIGLVVLILGSLSLYVVSLSVRGQIEVLTETERRLLYNTDHARLASACEKLWRQREEVRKLVKPSNSTTAPIDVSSTHPSVPPEIQLLRVTGLSVQICPDYLRLELGGGFCHYGFFWQTDPRPTFGKNQSGQPLVNKQVASNLWFFTESRRLPEPK